MILFSLIIPNWNGKKLLEKNLPSVLTAAKEERAEIIIIDNGSVDESLHYLQDLASQNPSFQIIKLPKNYGFSYAVNLGIKKAQGKIVVLLNNDVAPKKDFLFPLKKHFANPQVFAVSLNEPQFSWARGEFKNGFFAHQPGPKTQKTHLSLWASGGSAAFNRKLWLKLGGFDRIYHPFYWEDVDLGYRAWKRGYQVLWEPRSIVHHHHESTVSRFSPKYIDLIKQRNELLFIWKNITSSQLTNEHKKALLKRIIKSPGYLKIFLAALAKLPQVLSRRRQEKKESQLTDEKIFKLFIQK